MRRDAYGGERTAEVHAEAEGRALGPLEERSMYSRHCASAREKEQERRVPRIGFEWRHYPSSTSAGAGGAAGGGAGGDLARGCRGSIGTCDCRWGGARRPDGEPGAQGARGGSPLPRERGGRAGLGA